VVVVVVVVKQSVEYDPNDEWVQAGETSWLPRQFLVKRAEVTRRRIPDVIAGVHVELVDPGRAAGVTLYDHAWTTPVARSVEVATIYGEVQDKHLRTVPIIDMVEAGAAALVQPDPNARPAAQSVDRGDRKVLKVAAPSAPAKAIPEVKQARNVLGRPRVDLAVVAGVYKQAQQQGRRDPTVAVAEHIDSGRSTAAAYVSKARQAGLLPPARK